MHVLVAGAGWLGLEIGRFLAKGGYRVTAVRRREAGRQAIVDAGASPLILDLSDPASAGALPEGLDAIVSCVASPEGGAAAYRNTYVDANRTLLGYADRQPLAAFVYTSSTGVFGRSDGGDVDETTAPDPSSETGRVLVEAEQIVLAAAVQKIRACVVRLSGLYGPYRIGIAERVRSGRLALGPRDDTWMNFCHRDDAVALVLAVLEGGRRGAVYHGSDAFPARRRDVITWIADRLGIEPTRAPASSSNETAGANRRVLGVATRRELGLSLRYPSFRDGLEPLLCEVARKSSG